MSKGALPYTGTSMPKGRSGLSNTSKERMSGAHGLNSGNPSKGMHNEGNRIGKGCAGFSGGADRQMKKAGGQQGAGHTSQPSGHKSKA